jgi:uncharacterized protein (DUF4415 family)
MKDHYDFSKGKRGQVIPTPGKTRVTIYLDNDLLDAFRARAAREGKGYQTLINEALRIHLGDHEGLDATLLRKIIREELRRADRA